MSKLKYISFRNQHFGNAVRKIGEFDGFNQKNKYRAIKFMEWIRAEEKIAQGMWIAILKKVAELDEKGELKSPENAPQGSFRVLPGKEEEFKKLGEEWAEIEITFDKALPIDRAEADKVGFTVNEEIALEGFIEAVSEETPEAL